MFLLHSFLVMSIPINHHQSRHFFTFFVHGKASKNVFVSRNAAGNIKKAAEKLQKSRQDEHTHNRTQHIIETCDLIQRAGGRLIGSLLAPNI